MSGVELKGRHALGAVAAALGLLAVLGLVLRERPPPDRHAFPICVGLTPKPREVWNDAVLAAVVRSLAEDERSRLEDALAAAATRWEARANPVLEDLEGGDPDEEIARWFRTAPTFVRTAQASARVQVCAPDGFCATVAGERGCPSGWGPPKTDRDGERARFLVWPWGHAFRFTAPSETAATAIAARLRAHLRKSTRLAVVLVAEDVRATKVPPFVRISELWHKVAVLRRLARTGGEGSTVDAGEANPLAVGDPRTVIVLPRLAAIDDDPAIVREVQEIAPELR